MAAPVCANCGHEAECHGGRYGCHHEIEDRDTGQPLLCACEHFEEEEKDDQPS